MYQLHSTVLAAVLAGIMATSAHAAPESSGSVPAAQGKNMQEEKPASSSGSKAATTTGKTGDAASSGTSQADCPPLMNQSAAERIAPSGPVGTSGSTGVEGGGTVGSTGETRASTTSGATGTTGEAGGYSADASGSVTTTGSTGDAPSSAIECQQDMTGATTGNPQSGTNKSSEDKQGK